MSLEGVEEGKAKRKEAGEKKRTPQEKVGTYQAPMPDSESVKRTKKGKTSTLWVSDKGQFVFLFRSWGGLGARFRPIQAHANRSTRRGEAPQVSANL